MLNDINYYEKWQNTNTLPNSKNPYQINDLILPKSIDRMVNGTFSLENDLINNIDEKGEATSSYLEISIEYMFRKQDNYDHVCFMGELKHPWEIQQSKKELESAIKQYEERLIEFRQARVNVAEWQDVIRTRHKIIEVLARNNVKEQREMTPEETKELETETYLTYWNKQTEEGVIATAMVRLLGNKIKTLTSKSNERKQWTHEDEKLDYLIKKLEYWKEREKNSL